MPTLRGTKRVECRAAPPETPYPKLRKDHDTGIIVLSSSETQGLFVSGSQTGKVYNKSHKNLVDWYGVIEIAQDR